MKICIIGAGSIGGFLGTRLAATGAAQVSAVARGATLAALKKRGWRLRQADSVLTAPALASENPAELGVQDLVIVAVKGPALAQVARSIGPLLDEHTLVMPAMNGVPWWFLHGLPAGNTPLETVDPGGVVSASIPIENVVGCVMHASTSVAELGLVQHKMGVGLIIGEPLGGRSERVQRLATLLTNAGFDVTHSANIRYDIWYKLWGNMTMNPVSAITGATAGPHPRRPTSA
jgi:2-dehydropantoate 2-reductase